MSPLKIELREIHTEATDTGQYITKKTTTELEALTDHPFSVRSGMAISILGISKTTLFRTERNLGLEITRVRGRVGEQDRECTDDQLLKIANALKQVVVNETGKGIFSLVSESRGRIARTILKP